MVSPIFNELLRGISFNFKCFEFKPSQVIEPIVEDAIEVIEPLKENSNTDSENLNSEIGDS